MQTVLHAELDRLRVLSNLLTAHAPHIARQPHNTEVSLPCVTHTAAASAPSSSPCCANPLSSSSNTMAPHCSLLMLAITCPAAMVVTAQGMATTRLCVLDDTHALAIVPHITVQAHHKCPFEQVWWSAVHVLVDTACAQQHLHHVCWFCSNKHSLQRVAQRVLCVCLCWPRWPRTC